MNTREILQHLQSGDVYKDGAVRVSCGTLYLRGVPVLELRHDEVEFHSAAFSTQALILQRTVFAFMQQQGMIDQKKVFTNFRVLNDGGYTIPICKPKPAPMPVYYDTRELL